MEIDIQKVRDELLMYGEATLDHYDHITLDELDISVSFLVENMDDDDFCIELLRAMLGDEYSAKIITEMLNKHIVSMYEEEIKHV